MQSQINNHLIVSHFQNEINIQSARIIAISSLIKITKYQLLLMFLEQHSKQELLQKVCLLEAYVQTLQDANQTKYHEICLQAKVITQLKQQTNKMQNRMKFPSYFYHELEERLETSTQMCLELQKQNQILKTKIAQFQSGKPIFRSQNIKHQESPSRSKDIIFAFKKNINPQQQSVNTSQIKNLNFSNYEFHTRKNCFENSIKMIGCRIQSNLACNQYQKERCVNNGNNCVERTMYCGQNTFSFGDLNGQKILEGQNIQNAKQINGSSDQKYNQRKLGYAPKRKEYRERWIKN